jgi:hypothetical protein
VSPSLLIRAAEVIEQYALEIRRSCALGPEHTDWICAEDEKGEHDEMVGLAAELRAAAGEDEDVVMVFGGEP